MKLTNSKLSEQFSDFIDLTDADLEEINVPELGRVQGAGCGIGIAISSAFAGGSCFGFDFGSCGSCESCGSCSCSCWSCSCSCSCSCWSCSCSCSCWSCSCSCGFGGF